MLFTSSIPILPKYRELILPNDFSSVSQIPSSFIFNFSEVFFRISLTINFEEIFGQVFLKC